MSVETEHAGLMDRLYRHQRHVYDLTRKYYLIGRDPMLAGLDVPEGGTVLEIGCGTGRNLVAAARRYPTARLHGIDISREMLASAGAAVVKAGTQGRTRLAHADAATFDPRRVFGRERFDRVFIAYAVSMIPAWQRVMESAAQRLEAGGALHVVDFGNLAGFPSAAQRLFSAGLALHHVTPRPGLFAFAAEIAARHGLVAEARRLHRGFTWLAILRRPAE